MNAEWEPPEDAAELAAWLENFAEKIPQHAEQLGITPEQVAEVRQQRDSFCAAHEKEVTLRFEELSRRLAQFRPREQWPVVFADAAERWLLTPEPVRTRWLELLEKWFEGIRRVQGRAVQPDLRGGYFKQGVRLTYDFPDEIQLVKLYYRRAGEASWEFLSGNTQSMYYLYTMVEGGDANADAERQSWHGEVLEFVAIAELEERAIGFPSDIVRVRVPVEYPIAGAAD